jgi:hypothetical protein
MKRMTVDEFHAAFKAQGAVSPLDIVLVCPACGTPQSARDFLLADQGKTFEEIERLLGWSCIGRFTGAPAPRAKPDGKPCNWTLGGLLKLHTLEVIDDDGVVHMRFEPASPEVAQAYLAARA